MNLKPINQKSNLEHGAVTGGLAVRTNLRAGFSLDDLGDQAQALLDKLTNAVSSVTTNTDTTAAPTA